MNKGRYFRRELTPSNAPTPRPSRRPPCSLSEESNSFSSPIVNLHRVVVVGAAQLARGLLGRHPLLDALPLLRVQLFLVDSLHLELRLQFL